MKKASKRTVRCTMCTQYRWRGNAKGRFKAKEEALEKAYRAEVLCDDGEQFSWEGWAKTAEDAKDQAWNAALQLQLKPVEVETYDETE